MVKIMYVVEYEGVIHKRTSHRTYTHAVIARVSSIIRDKTCDDKHYMESKKFPASCMFVSWAGSPRLAEREAMRMRRRYADVVVKEAKVW